MLKVVRLRSSTLVLPQATQNPLTSGFTPTTKRAVLPPLNLQIADFASNTCSNLATLPMENDFMTCIVRLQFGFYPFAILFSGYSKPFNIRVHTDGAEGSSSPAETNNRGFCFKFVQQPCTSTTG